MIDDERTTQAIDELRWIFMKITPSQRIEILDRLADGYCKDCGDATDGRICHCENDE
jgi:hypothetical protein